VTSVLAQINGGDVYQYMEANLKKSREVSSTHLLYSLF
jgi:hypothetical protein